MKEFKLAAIAAAGSVAAALSDVLGLTSADSRNVVAAATGMAGALWQMAAPGTSLRELYETDPDLAHAIVDVEPRLADVLRAAITGYLAG